MLESEISQALLNKLASQGLVQHLYGEVTLFGQSYFADHVFQSPQDQCTILIELKLGANATLRRQIKKAMYSNLAHIYLGIVAQKPSKKTLEAWDKDKWPRGKAGLLLLSKEDPESFTVLRSPYYDPSAPLPHAFNEIIPILPDLPILPEATHKEATTKNATTKNAPKRYAPRGKNSHKLLLHPYNQGVLAGIPSGQHYHTHRSILRTFIEQYLQDQEPQDQEPQDIVGDLLTQLKESSLTRDILSLYKKPRTTIRYILLQDIGVSI